MAGGCGGASGELPGGLAAVTHRTGMPPSSGRPDTVAPSSLSWSVDRAIHQNFGLHPSTWSIGGKEADLPKNTRACRGLHSTLDALVATSLSVNGRSRGRRHGDCRRRCSAAISIAAAWRVSATWPKPPPGRALAEPTSSKMQEAPREIPGIGAAKYPSVMVRFASAMAANVTQRRNVRMPLMGPDADSMVKMGSEMRRQRRWK